MSKLNLQIDNKKNTITKIIAAIVLLLYLLPKNLSYKHLALNLPNDFENLYYLYNFFSTIDPSQYISLILNNSWHKLFLANFMHFDLNHLMFNLINVFILSSVIENIVGKKNLLILFFAASSFSNFLVMLYQNMQLQSIRFGGISTYIYVCFGALCMTAFLKYLKDKEKSNLNIVIIAFALILLQLSSDYYHNLNNPYSQHSLTGHLLGFISGLYFSYFLIQQQKKHGAIA